MQKKYYETGGGVVIDGRGRLLMLERWVDRDGVRVHELRLPKGHIDPGERPEEAARREVCEESGYCDLETIAPLGEQTVEFIFRDRQVRRREFYFLMRLRSPYRRAPDVAPDSEEALFEVRWAVDPAAAERGLTYESEREFVRRAAAMRQETSGGEP